jgi:MFS family permease
VSGTGAVGGPEEAKAEARLLRHRPFMLFFTARMASRFAVQIATVAVGWQVYAMTNSALALGMIGLAQFLPTALLVFFAGHAADRYERRRLLQICQIVQGCVAAFLAWGAFGDWLTVHMLYGAVTVFGIATAFEAPASAALLPAVAPPGQVQRATAMTTGGFQLAVICGPAIGGFAFAASPGLPYVLMAGLWIVASCFNALIHVDRPTGGRPGARLSELFAGVRFVRSNRPILGTISLDLFAVLLGGATALMPIFARDVLHTGPWGLGALRGAPAIGALAMTVLLARTSINRRVGMRMFQAVIVFGLATVVFALSKSMALSLAALAVMGAADTVSVVIRTSLVQLRTPDAMRGRVGAVNFLFINASNQLGEFESGVVAALIGAVPAAVVGGFGTVLVALLWMRIFPDLRKVERLE